MVIRIYAWMSRPDLKVLSWFHDLFEIRAAFELDCVVPAPINKSDRLELCP